MSVRVSLPLPLPLPAPRSIKCCNSSWTWVSASPRTCSSRARSSQTPRSHLSYPWPTLPRTGSPTSRPERYLHDGAINHRSVSAGKGKGREEEEQEERIQLEEAQLWPTTMRPKEGHFGHVWSVNGWRCTYLPPWTPLFGNLNLVCWRLAKWAPADCPSLG